MTNLQDVIEQNLTINLANIENHDKELIEDIQSILKKIRYYQGEIDGIAIVDGKPENSATLKALGKFKKDNFLEYPFIVGVTTAKRLIDSDSVGNKFFPPTNGGGWISSPFGQRWGRNHNGVDVAIPTGTRIFSICDGIIYKVVSGCKEGNYNCGGGYGNQIWLKAGNLDIVYAHLVSCLCKENDHVRKGAIIGMSGNSGHSTGPHLHLGIMDKGKWVNPQLIMNVL